jgi:hypothetical protein
LSREVVYVDYGYAPFAGDTLAHMRSLFTWGVTGIIVPAIISVAGVVVGVTLDSQAGPALLVIGALWICATIVLDNSIKSKLFGCVVIGAATMVFVGWIESVIRDKELKEREGALVSGNLPSPLSTCPIPGDALAIYMGSSASWTKTFPHVVFQSRGNELLTLNRDANGGLLISAKIFDDRTDLVAKLENNHFIATNAASHFERPDRSALVVYDHLDKPVLDIHFLNDHAVQISSATLRAPGGQTVSIQKGTMIIGNQFINRACFGGVGADFVF